MTKLKRFTAIFALAASMYGITACGQPQQVYQCYDDDGCGSFQYDDDFEMDGGFEFDD